MSDLFGLDSDGCALRNVDTVQEHTDILVLDSGCLLNRSSRLRDVIEGSSTENNLILLIWGSFNSNTFQHVDLADKLFTQEVADLNDLSGIGNRKIDGEMGIGAAHLVLETLRKIRKQFQKIIKCTAVTPLIMFLM